MILTFIRIPDFITFLFLAVVTDSRTDAHPDKSRVWQTPMNQIKTFQGFTSERFFEQTVYPS